MYKKITFLSILFCCANSFLILKAQLIITPQTSGLALAQKLVGQGVTISNVILTADNRSIGFFKNISGTNIGLDSGVVLTNGRAKSSNASIFGVDGNNSLPAYSSSSTTGAFASLSLQTPGDADLDNLISDNTFDATILEFDFIPSGDSVKFRYVFSSEEYPDYPCTGVNDVFAFLIQGPGYPINTNIALIPGTLLPVTIDNINNLPGCGPFPQFYVSNQQNTAFTHNGHTTVFTAIAAVQPCQSYHLKIAIADVGDGIIDSGVFLEAQSLNSLSTTVTNVTPVDVLGNNFLAEGCVSGIVKIKRQNATAFPQTINLQYSGTATNGLDVQLLPATITIPANQIEVDLNIVALQDNLIEGIENLIVSAVNVGCGTGSATTSTSIQIRDYDRLSVSPGRAPDTAYICRNATQLLTASLGYTTYTWNNTATLNNSAIRTPLATPVNNISKYICTAVLNQCNARDSLNLKWKDISVLSKTNIICANTNTGQIKIEAGLATEWAAPLQFSINGLPFQNDSTFNNLGAGSYTIRIKDASGCIDSITTSLINLSAPITFTIQKIQPSCLSGNTGTFTVNVVGGNLPYTFSIDGGSYQPLNMFNTIAGVHTISVKDINGCINSQLDSLDFVNGVSLSTFSPVTICEGSSTTLSINSNATNFIWTPSTGLSTTSSSNPVANPNVTTKYYVKATIGACFKTDSVTVNVNPAPIANAGIDKTLCYNESTQLTGSGGIEYLWSPQTFLSSNNILNPLVINPTRETIYTLVVKDGNGCKSLNVSTVKISTTPIVKIFAGNDTLIAINQPFPLQVVQLSSAGPLNFEWTNPNGLNFSNIYNPIGTLNTDWEYYVTGTTVNNCKAYDSVKIKIYNGPDIYIPNTFTPNGDKNNDVLKPICIGIKSLNYFRIYNRYGQLIYETNIFNNGWNGFFKGTKQDISTYVWVVQGIDFKNNIIQKKGTTILVR